MQLGQRQRWGFTGLQRETELEIETEIEIEIEIETDRDRERQADKEPEIERHIITDTEILTQQMKQTSDFETNLEQLQEVPV